MGRPTKRLSADKQQLIQYIKDEAKSLLERTEPSSREVGAAVLAKHKDLIRRLAGNLAEAWIYSMSSDLMKRSAIPTEADSEQFCLPGISGVPQTITFRLVGCDHNQYVNIGRAKQFHVLSYREILKGQHAALHKAITAMDTLVDALADVWKKAPNATVTEAWAMVTAPPPRKPPTPERPLSATEAKQAER
jgi:hypothetical protein